MTSVSAAEANGSARPVVPARALLPWLPQQGALNLAGAVGPVDADAVTAQWRAMQNALNSRSRNVPTDPIVGDLPTDLNEHVAEVRAAGEFAPFAAEGWEPSLVDLGAIIAAQPCVRRGASRPAEDFSNVVGLARVTLPLAAEVDLDLFVDNPTKPGVIKVASTNPNLRVVGFVNGHADGHASTQVVGAVVGATPSYMQVGIYAGRPILRDGYHRAVELLERGVTVVPALVRAIDNIDQLFPAWQRPQMLPEDAWLGRKPPLLSDYLDDELCATVRLPAVSKAIVISIAEVPWP
jgi:hypothetical protein